MNPKFSIVIPIYNAERYLKETLESVRKQNYEDFEVLLINDGSNDKSVDICLNFSNRDNRFHLYQKSNGGVCSARNYGIREAKGEYILFIDSDDVVEQTMLSNCLKKIQKSGADILIFGMSFDVEKNGRIIKSLIKSCETDLFTSEELEKYYRYLYDNNYITSLCNRIIRTSIIRNNDLRFNEKLTNYEDMAFSLECLRYAEKIQSIAECYYHYIIHDELGMSRKYKPNLSNTLSETVKVLTRNIDALPLSQATKEWARKDVQRILWIGVANICREKSSVGIKRTAVKNLCSQSWVREFLPMEMTGNRYNDICVKLYRNSMWTLEVIWNTFSNILRDIRY